LGAEPKVHLVSTHVISAFLANRASLDTRICRMYDLAYSAHNPGRALLMEVAMASFRSQNTESARTLVSWKEIAVFLNHSESTVKRWERDRGLPVHRIPGGERGGVFAYPDELADWIKGKALELEPDDSTISDQKSAGSADPGAASESKIDPRPDETAGRSGGQGNARRVRLAVIGIAAALAGAGIYANFAHPFGRWIQRHFPVIAGIGKASSTGQVVAPVSEAEKRAAHDLYLKGRFEWNQRTPDSLNGTPTKCSSSTEADRMMTLAIKPWLRPERR
jgi:hypothetical protein